MADLVMIYMGIAMLLYVLLGGADFGAGILEIFTGKKGINTISKAIAPVWEANHIWLIVIIVILFNAFPRVYSSVMFVLHIPLFLVLIGIIFRGTAFTFRYYDPYSDRSHAVYTFVFKAFSVLTPLFLGVSLGAVILGKITLVEDAGFLEKFVFPWLNIFSFTLGIFMILLFAYLAAVFLSGETTESAEKDLFPVYSKRLLILLVVGGVMVFLTAWIDGLHLLSMFVKNAVSLLASVIATLLIPLIWFGINKFNPWLTRLLAGIQIFCILLGWFSIQYPTLVRTKEMELLTIDNSIAPYKTVLMMVIALSVGLLVVIPFLLYLFKVFKFSKFR